MLSKATIGRLPAYLNYLRCIPSKTPFISATAVAKALKLGEVQVRKDFAMICGEGRPKTGYKVDNLVSAMETLLGMHTQSEAVIVGGGKLGKALLEFRGFSEYGIGIHRAFDTHPDSTCDKILPISELPAYCNLHQVEIGILTVPPDAAQETADLLIKSGIQAIWCFAVCRLTVPDSVIVQYENMALSLAHLKNRVKYN